MATLREIIDNSNYAVFFGGAGVSTASNIPDFRGKNGIYNTENEWGLPPEIIISHTFFTRRTKDFCDYYKKYMVYPSAVPNAVHIALARLEKEGIISPVIGIECQYKHPTTFDDEVRIHVEIAEFKRIELVISYTITNNKTGELVLTGKTHHCFTNADGRPIPLKRQFPELDGILRSLAPATQSVQP